MNARGDGVDAEAVGAEALDLLVRLHSAFGQPYGPGAEGAFRWARANLKPLVPHTPEQRAFVARVQRELGGVQ